MLTLHIFCPPVHQCEGCHCVIRVARLEGVLSGEKARHLFSKCSKSKYLRHQPCTVWCCLFTTSWLPINADTLFGYSEKRDQPLTQVNLKMNPPSCRLPVLCLSRLRWMVISPRYTITMSLHVSFRNEETEEKRYSGAWSYATNATLVLHRFTLQYSEKRALKVRLFFFFN